MIKYYCDHCGAEITEKRNNVECTMYSDAGAGVFHRGEFCDKCSDILSSFFAYSEVLAEEADAEEADAEEADNE